MGSIRGGHFREIEIPKFGVLYTRTWSILPALEPPERGLLIVGEPRIEQKMGLHGKALHESAPRVALNHM